MPKKKKLIPPFSRTVESVIFKNLKLIKCVRGACAPNGAVVVFPSYETKNPTGVLRSCEVICVIIRPNRIHLHD